MLEKYPFQSRLGACFVDLIRFSRPWACFVELIRCSRPWAWFGELKRRFPFALAAQVLGGGGAHFRSKIDQKMIKT